MSDDEIKTRKQQIREIYRYDEMSNKVLKVDKRLQTTKSDPQRDAELSQPTSMGGKISAKEMGMSVRREASPEDREEAKKILERQQMKNREPNERPATSMRSVLDYESTTLNYYPRDETNRAVYEEVLQWVTDVVGTDVPHDLIATTADLLISILKGDGDEADGRLDKRRAFIEQELELPLQPAKFQELVKIVKQITDYNDSTAAQEAKAVPVFFRDASEEDEFKEEGTALLDELEEDEEAEDQIEADAGIQKNFIPGDSPRLLAEHDDETIILTGKRRNVLKEVSIHEVDEFFIRRVLNDHMKELDASSVQQISDKILEALGRNEDKPKQLESELMDFFGPEKSHIAQHIIENRNALLWGIRLAGVGEDVRPQLLQEMKARGLNDIAEQYEEGIRMESKRAAEEALDHQDVDEVDLKRLHKSNHKPVPPLLDLRSLVFDEGANLMTISKVSLPNGSYKKVNQHYEEIHIPAPKKPEINYPLIPISSLPIWAQEAFPSNETETFNPIQSKVFASAFQNSTNLLLCAPTGAGKTNVAMLCVLRAISDFIISETKKLRSKHFKIVYLAPLKALVQEQVREFRRRLSYLDINVEELTGDSNLSRHQIAETQLLVSTPEKWDVITRKATETSSFVEQVTLLIIDEIHLLHDQRGPVLESIVARSLRSVRSPPRIVGLSATLPNYQDVAKFLRVPTDGLFYFDASFRPCPLSQQFCGVTEKNSLKRLHAADEACYDKTLDAVNNGHQVIIFVHSRRETVRLAKYLRQKFSDNGNLDSLQKLKSASKHILETEAEKVQNSQLAQVLKQGVGVHHAGLSRSDRSLSEDLFADGLLQVLVSTATLAWGVNLPAHTVIIKGTDVYSAEKGVWTRLAPQDLLQMLGRAGRPRYDTYGEGIVITNQTDVQYFLAILNQQLPIESQFVSTIVDALNAEVVSGSIKSREDAVSWLSYTYLYVRMLVSPQLYNVSDHEGDETLYRYRDALAHSAFTVLQEEKLVVYDAEDGTVQSTELGRIASYFYIRHNSMVTYNRELNVHSSQIDLFRIIAMSGEFEYLSVKPEERRELKELLGRAPIPVREGADESLAKINILLQSYISKLRFEGFALNADMTYINQNAGRISRALYELSLKKGYSRTSKTLLDICKMIENRAWVANSPLRQIKTCPLEVIRKTEASTLSWRDYLELDSPAQVGQAVRSEKHGKMVYDYLRRFPKLLLRCSLQPLTASLLKIELEILPDWIWDSKLHNFSEQFAVIIEDTDGERIIYFDRLLIRKENLYEPQTLEIPIQLSAAQQKRLPPNFFISLLSERWLNCEAQLALDMRQLRLPKRFPAPTSLIDMKLIPTSELNVEQFSNVFDFTAFNKFQSQAFHSVYNSNANVLVGAAKGAGKTVLAELALLNHWRQNKGRAVYICPRQEKIDYLVHNWNKRLSGLAGGKTIDKLGLEITLNLRIIAQSHLILATPDQFEHVSRNWRQKKNLQNFDLFIYDDVHVMSDGLSGAVYEVLISRLSFISNQLDNKTRIVALASCIANGLDFGEWLGVSKANIFNFSPQERAASVKIQLNSFDLQSNVAHNQSMMKCAFEFAQTDSTIIYLPTRLSCFRIATSIIEYAEDYGWSIPGRLNDGEFLDAALQKIEDPLLRVPLAKGVGILYQGMTPKDKKLVTRLYSQKVLIVLLVTRDCCFQAPNTSSVVVLGTQYFDGKEQRYVSYSANDILEMIGTAQSDGISKALILTNLNMKEYYKKFLLESLPVESLLYFSLHELLMAEISNSVIQGKQDCVDWLAYTYFYRRLHANPSFYGVKDVSPYGVSAYLTEIVETTLMDLQNSSIIEIEGVETPTKADIDKAEETITPLTGCFVSAHYNISFLSLSMLLSSLSGSTTLQDMLMILSKASEFDAIPIREDEMPTVKKLNQRVPHKVDDIGRENLLSSKVYLLLQAHFSRLKLTPELALDLQVVLEKSVPLVSAMVDLLSGDGRLNAMTAMDLSQMITQGVWDVDSPLKQIPYFDDAILALCADKRIETVYDIMALEDDEREELMPSDERKLFQIANFVNNYPNVELEYLVDQNEQLKAGERRVITVTLSRDEMPETLVVDSKALPFERLESWWLVLGEVATKQLHAIKKVSLRRETQKFDLDFMLDKGQHQLTVWCVCNSYLDADKEVAVSLDVV